LNWSLMAAVIFTLLPAKLDYPLVLGVLLISAIAGVITHIPAGLGVLEAVFIALLQHEASRGSLLAGLIAYRFLPISALPEVDYPTIQVRTLYPGASPDVMAVTVTGPLERQFGQMAGLNRMSSTSSAGASVVTLQFKLNLTLDVAEQEVQAAINAAGTLLPADLPAPPIYAKVNPADAPVISLGITSKTRPLAEVQSLVAPRGLGRHQALLLITDCPDDEAPGQGGQQDQDQGEDGPASAAGPGLGRHRTAGCEAASWSDSNQVASAIAATRPSTNPATAVCWPNWDQITPNSAAEPMLPTAITV
jgi:hypothetical protein